jgi:aspartate/methionine/tyrosine aminotransferase
MTTTPTAASKAVPADAFRQLPFMGVIRVNNEAMKVGYKMGDPAWCNLGQGQPEVGELSGAPARFSTLEIDVADNAYGPVEGLPELREAISAHYNRLYRQGKASKYTAANVAVAAGGRLALTRIGATLENVRLGYFTPDYTAYEDLLVTFHRLDPYWIELRPEDGFRIDPEALEARVVKEKLGSLLISNPCNPTGVVVRGQELAAWVEMARRRSCTLLMDEFYSHYVYAADQSGPVSAAAYVEDIERDPVVIVDGLTKCFRYPGWRVGWVVAPQKVIQALTAAGSFLDGGPSRPIQRAAISVLEPSRADQETQAVQRAFAEKQRITISKLREAGVEFPGKPEGTFYAFGDIGRLPAPLNDGIAFMREAFKHKVLTVPGEFFDVNPHRARPGPSPLAGFVRFSFGPPKAALESGLGRLVEMIRGAGKR